MRATAVLVLAFMVTVTGAVESQPCRVSTDFVFVIDVSYSIQASNFRQYVLPFVQNLVLGLDVGPESDQARVGAITFSDGPHLVFHLNSDKPDVLREVSTIYYMGGETFTAQALKFARENMFGHENGGRAGVDRVLIVLTDGSSQNQTKTMEEVEKCRQQRIKIFAIGVGSADENELRAMSTTPAVKFMFYVSDFQALDSIRSTLLENACGSSRQNSYDQGVDRALYALPCSRPTTDILLSIDESFSIGSETFYKEVLPFLQRVVNGLDIGCGQHQAQVGALAYGNFARILFRLDRHTDKSRLSSAISRIRYTGGGTNTNTALKLAKDQLLKRSHGARHGAHKVIILLTDGRSDNRQAAVKEADAARQCGIEIFAIGVGDADKEELRTIASQPAADHVFYVSSFRDLNSVTDCLAAKLTVCY